MFFEEKKKEEKERKEKIQNCFKMRKAVPGSETHNSDDKADGSYHFFSSSG